MIRWNCLFLLVFASCYLKLLVVAKKIISTVLKIFCELNRFLRYRFSYVFQKHGFCGVACYIY